MNKRLIIFIDSGDTIIDEGTEIRDENGTVIKADVIFGADVTLRAIYNEGYKIVLVADGDAQSIKNVMNQNSLADCFSAVICSEHIKHCKPDRRMFKAAIGSIDATECDIKHIVMVGNNLERDIKGANMMGITSIFMKWSPRYKHEPDNELEVPDFIIHKPNELIDLINKIEQSIN